MARGWNLGLDVLICGNTDEDDFDSDGDVTSSISRALRSKPAGFGSEWRA